MNPKAHRVLTTAKSEADVLKAYGLPANCYIVKPVDFEKFAEVVRSIENFWFSVVTLPGEPFILQPREFVLAITEECLELADDVLGRLEGRSSLGRIGIIVHGTAGLFDPGWSGKATLELSNLSRMPVALYPGMRICSFTFEQLSSPSSMPYGKKVGNKYSGQQRPLASRLAGEFKG